MQLCRWNAIGYGKKTSMWKEPPYVCSLNWWVHLCSDWISSWISTSSYPSSFVFLPSNLYLIHIILSGEKLIRIDQPVWFVLARINEVFCEWKWRPVTFHLHDDHSPRDSILFQQCRIPMHDNGSPMWQRYLQTNRRIWTFSITQEDWESKIQKIWSHVYKTQPRKQQDRLSSYCIHEKNWWRWVELKFLLPNVKQFVVC